MMTRMAVEECVLGPDTVVAEHGVRERVEDLSDLHRLPDGPDRSVRRRLAVRALPALVIRIDVEMRPLELREGVELEAQPRVAGAQELVAHELVGAAEMARQA